MNILVLCELAKKCEMITSDAVPRVGDRVDMFCQPAPTVTEILWWPSKSRQESMGIEHPADVFVIVE